MKPTPTPERPPPAQPRAHAGEGAPAPQAGHAEGVAPVCPLIPGRFKYTCSGRCKGCNDRHDPAHHAAAKARSHVLTTDWTVE